jgi:phosphate transport system substrate-binding protein
VNNLTTEQVRGIFNGTIRNWKELGGKDAPITVVSREAGSGTRSSFESIIGGVSLTRDAIVQDSSGTIRETVASDPNAVGYLSHGVVNEKVKPVTVDGTACTVETVASGEYKLVRPVFFLTKGAPAGAAKEFIDYVLSPEGQEVIKKDGLIPAK